MARRATAPTTTPTAEAAVVAGQVLRGRTRARWGDVDYDDTADLAWLAERGFRTDDISLWRLRKTAW